MEIGISQKYKAERAETTSNDEDDSVTGRPEHRNAGADRGGTAALDSSEVSPRSSTHDAALTAEQRTPRTARRNAEGNDARPAQVGYVLPQRSSTRRPGSSGSGDRRIDRRGRSIRPLEPAEIGSTTTNRHEAGAASIGLPPMWTLPPATDRATTRRADAVRP